MLASGYYIGNALGRRQAAQAYSRATLSDAEVKAGTTATTTERVAFAAITVIEFVAFWVIAFKTYRYLRDTRKWGSVTSFFGAWATGAVFSFAVNLLAAPLRERVLGDETLYGMFYNKINSSSSETKTSSALPDGDVKRIANTTVASAEEAARRAKEQGVKQVTDYLNSGGQQATQQVTKTAQSARDRLLSRVKR